MPYSVDAALPPRWHGIKAAEPARQHACVSPPPPVPCGGRLTFTPAVEAGVCGCMHARVRRSYGCTCQAGKWQHYGACSFFCGCLHSAGTASPSSQRGCIVARPESEALCCSHACRCRCPLQSRMRGAPDRPLLALSCLRHPTMRIIRIQHAHVVAPIMLSRSCSGAVHPLPGCGPCSCWRAPPPL